MTLFTTDRFEPPQDLKDFCEHGHERGAGPSLFPDCARVDVSLDLDLASFVGELAAPAPVRGARSPWWSPLDPFRAS